MDVSPRGFEPRRMHIFYRTRHRVRVVKELVLKANGLCPREFESRRCRFFELYKHAAIAQLGER
jgi:hypothetical protein